MYVGMFYISGSHYEYMSGKGLNWIILTIVTIPNIGFFIYWLWNVRLEILKYLFLKMRWTFRVITCGKYRDEDFKKRYLSNPQDN